MTPPTQIQANSDTTTSAEDAAPRAHLKPVAWLLGQQLIGQIKGILLYTAYGKKLDARDWMQASVLPDLDKQKALQAWREQHELEAAKQGRPLTSTAQNAEAFWAERKEFWFDYLADAGDGTRAMYSLAYLCMSNLWVRPMANKLPTELPAASDCWLKRDNEEGATMELPRGEFLFIGGDTAYHASDYMTLASRVKRPFRWAYKDLIRHKRISPDEPARPLYGIPGNHDYYDQLDGFRRQFRKPAKDEPPLDVETAGQKYAQLGIAGFYRTQTASYVALQLPFNCWLWGLDTEVGQIDDRQEKFFRDLCAKKPPTNENIPPDIIPPEKLILATCAPTTAFGKIATEKDYKAADAIGQLGLEQPFLPEQRADGTYNLDTSGDVMIDEGQCRLDISGDVHHYARYWGPAPKHGAQPARKDAWAKAKEAHSYASVVSGLGGAFHHPSTTYNDEIQEQVLYPTEDTSREAIARRVFKFKNIRQGGYVWLAGAIIAFIIYFAASVPPSSRQFINTVLSNDKLGLGLAQKEAIMPTMLALSADSSSGRTIRQAQEDTACNPVEPFALWRKLGIGSGQWEPPQGCQDATEPRYFLPIDFRNWPRDLQIGALLILFSLAPIIGTFGFSDRIFKAKGASGAGETESKASEVTRVAGRKRIRRAKVDLEETANPKWLLCSIIVLTVLLAFGGLVTVAPYYAHISPFVSSLLVLFSIIWAVGALLLGLRYSEFLFKRGHQHYLKDSDWRLTQWVSVLSVLSIVFGVWSFGRSNPAAFLASDITFILVLLGTPILLLLLTLKLSGELLHSAGTFGWLGKLAIGLWHICLQLAVPFLFVRRGTWLTWLVAAGLIVVFTWGGELLLKKNSRLGLSLAWLAFGAAILALPYLPANSGAEPTAAQLQTALASFLAAHYLTGLDWFRQLVPALLAGGVGAVMCCVWFGWYLGVCFAFNGHNNEVGGAARIESYKEFIRFRVTAKGLTGYVIAVDDVSMIDEKVKDANGKDVKDANGEVLRKDGEYLAPRLIDVFHLTLK